MNEAVSVACEAAIRTHELILKHYKKCLINLPVQYHLIVLICYCCFFIFVLVNNVITIKQGYWDAPNTGSTTLNGIECALTIPTLFERQLCK